MNARKLFASTVASNHVYRRHYDHISGSFSVCNELEVNETSNTIEERLTEEREDINNVICDDHECLQIEYESDHTEIDEEEDSGQLPSNCQSMASVCVANISPNSAMHRNVALYLLKLKEVHHLSQSAIDCVVAQTKSLLQQQMSLLRDSVNMELQQVSTQDDIQKRTDNAFQDMNDPFEHLSSAYMQEKYFREIFQLVDPIEIRLGERYDTKGYGSKRSKVLGYDSFQYIPLFDSLTNLLMDKSIYDQITTVRAHSCSELLSDFCDGYLFKNHPVFSTDPTALQIILYYDELELTNPVGCFVKKHKIGCLMFSLGNIHPRFRSSLKSMYLVAVAKSSVIDKYGIDRILQPFVRDINKLTESGLTITIDGHSITFLGALLAVIADTLASHQLGGFKESMSWALRICRSCMATKETIALHFVEERFELRTALKHCQQCDSLKEVNGTANSTKYGINRRSILEDVKHFSVAAKTLAHDFMHDLLEGVIPLEIKLLLKYLFSQKCITLDLINQRLQCFAFGYSEIGSRPVPLSTAAFDNDSKLRQSASRMSLLARVLPFLIGDKIPEECEYWEYYLTLLDILYIALSPTVSKSTVAYLRVLIEEHHIKFKELYPHVNIIPKMHYMVHYPSQILALGPLVRSWTMRYEAKLSLLKQSGLRSNFKNVAQTVTKHHQGWLCYYKQADLHVSSIEVPPAVKYGLLKDETEDLIANISAKIPGILMESTIARPAWLKITGHDEYRTNDCFLLVSVNEYGEPSFAKVIDIYLIADNIIIFLVQAYSTQFYSRYFHSYVLEPCVDCHLVCVDEIKDYSVYQTRKPFGNEVGKFISLKCHLEQECYD